MPTNPSKPTRFYTFTAVEPGPDARKLKRRDDLIIYIPRSQVPALIASLANQLENPTKALCRFYDGTLIRT